MLHIKFQGNRPFGSKEDDFEGFFYYIFHVTQIPCINFLPAIRVDATWIWLGSAEWFQGSRCLKMLTDGLFELIGKVTFVILPAFFKPICFLRSFKSLKCFCVICVFSF